MADGGGGGGKGWKLIIRVKKHGGEYTKEGTYWEGRGDRKRPCRGGYGRIAQGYAEGKEMV